MKAGERRKARQAIITASFSPFSSCTSFPIITIEKAPARAGKILSAKTVFPNIEVLSQETRPINGGTETNPQSRFSPRV